MLNYNELYTFEVYEESEGEMTASVKNVGSGGQGQWVLYLTGSGIGIGGNYDENTEDEVYVIGSEELHYKTDVTMSSGSGESRKRKSNIKIDMLDDKGMEIKSITE